MGMISVPLGVKDVKSSQEGLVMRFVHTLSNILLASLYVVVILS